MDECCLNLLCSMDTVTAHRFGRVNNDRIFDSVPVKSSRCCGSHLRSSLPSRLPTLLSSIFHFFVWTVRNRVCLDIERLLASAICRVCGFQRQRCCHWPPDWALIVAGRETGDCSRCGNSVLGKHREPVSTADLWLRCVATVSSLANGSEAVLSEL